MNTTQAQGLLLDVGVVFFKSAWEVADQYEQLRGLLPGTVVGRGPLDSGTDERWDRYLQGEATEREYWLDFAAKAQANGAPLDGSAGSSPHMQGKRSLPSNAPVRLRFIPANAGQLPIRLAHL